MVNRFVHWLLRKQLICQEDIELYKYACVSFLLLMAPFIIATVIGAIYGKIISAVITVLPFVFMRKFTGGFHFHNLKLCLISSIIILWICLKIAWNIKFVLGAIASAIISVIIIVIFGPIDNENKSLLKNEKRKYRQIALFIGCLFILVDIISYIVGNNEIAISVSMGIILTMVLYVGGALYALVRKKKNHMPL